MFDLISIGDTVINTVIPLLDAELVDIEGQKMIAIPFGFKVPVGEAGSTVGGNAANNAIGSARLGLKTALYTNVGNKDDDTFDDRIIAKLKKEKVDIRYVVENEDLLSDHQVILTFNGERTILDYHQPWVFSLPDFDRSKWLYLTSMSPSYIKTNIMGQIANYLERSRAKLVYQPGTFQIKQGVKNNSKLLSLTDVFILNLEEAMIFLDLNKSLPIKKILEAISNLGPRKVIITDGKKGSYGFDGEKYFKMDIFPAKVVEMTGAGDAYSTGVIAALFHNKTLDEAMRWGAANSSSVVEYVGAQDGLLNMKQMIDRLEEYSKILAKEI